jgi:hypothetical protein
MNKYCKHFIGAATVLMLMSSPALACGGKACSPKSCAQNAGHAQGCAAGDKACAMNKMRHAGKGHALVPGKTSNYTRKILSKAEFIGLSETQQKQIEDLLAKAEASTAIARKLSSALVQELYGKLRSGDVSDDEIKAYAQRMGELRAAHLEANLMASVHASTLMSDEQKAKLYADKKSQAGKK